MNWAGWLIPTSNIFFQPSGEIHGSTAVWALHTTRFLSMGLDGGGLALLADGIRFCFAWQGASTHDPQWVEPDHTANTVPGLSNTAALAWKYSSSYCWNLGISPVFVLQQLNNSSWRNDSAHCYPKSFIKTKWRNSLLHSLINYPLVLILVLMLRHQTFVKAKSLLWVFLSTRS